MMKLKFAFAALALVATPLAAAEPAEETAVSDATVSIAEDYLAAYSTFNVDTMAPFLSDDMVFYDPTSTTENADGGSFIFEGKDAVLKGLGDYAAQYKSFSVAYDVERRYESNGVVVFVAQLSYDLVTKDDQTFTGSAPIVTAVTVKDGKVVKHLDLYDYAGNVKTFTD
ncbi:nuclear transport factor 2 family protein [Hyphococcus sp.]|uniref:nuclear transport factor 2 family protein n=1 Tax=Hyphococcus sp. TaxID=2038636 RepID=UPI0035C771C9